MLRSPSLFPDRLPVNSNRRGRLKEKAKDAIPALKLAIADSDEDVRSVAKKALAAINEALGAKVEVAKIDEKLAPLVKDLQSKDKKVRLASIAKMEEMGEAAKPAGAALVGLGMMSPDPAVREAANSAMEKIEPLIYKDLITIYYDKDTRNKDQARV